MRLKVEEQCMKVVNDDDLDRFIAHVYGIPRFSFACDMEARNDTEHMFHVSREKLSEYDAAEIYDMVEGKLECPGWATTAILTDMCNKRLIEPGTYLIKVSWQHAPVA